MPFYDEESYRRIPYEEYKAINELMHAHLRTHNGKLRALIAFGEIVTRGGTFDIDLLEVVEDWQGPTPVTFSSSEALPLRGQLRLYLLTPEAFEGAGSDGEASERLLYRVREGYDVIYETPPGYARNVLAQRVRNDFSDNPLDFLVSGSSGKQP